MCALPSPTPISEGVLGHCGASTPGCVRIMGKNESGGQEQQPPPYGSGPSSTPTPTRGRKCRRRRGGGSADARRGRGRERGHGRPPRTGHQQLLQWPLAPSVLLVTFACLLACFSSWCLVYTVSSPPFSAARPPNKSPPAIKKNWRSVDPGSISQWPQNRRSVDPLIFD
jgi:hypothetical protein